MTCLRNADLTSGTGGISKRQTRMGGKTQDNPKGTDKTQEKEETRARR